MRIGFSLGPFRIGFGGGRTTYGVSVGPVSLSTGGGSRSGRPVAEEKLVAGDAEWWVAQAQGEGWRVSGGDPRMHIYYLQRRMSGLEIAQVAPHQTRIRAIMSRPVQFIVAAVLVAVGALIWVATH